MNTSTALAALAFVVPSVAASADIFPRGQSGPITDNGVTTYEFNVTTTGQVGRRFTFDLDINHTWVGDLTITLEHAGTSVTLLDRPGVPESTVGNGADLAGVYSFIDGGSAWDETPGAQSGVTVAPGAWGLNNTDGTTLDDFRGLEVNGVWTLTVSDALPFDTGSVNGWSFSYVPAPGAAALFGVGAIASARRRR